MHQLPICSLCCPDYLVLLATENTSKKDGPCQKHLENCLDSLAISSAMTLCRDMTAAKWNLPGSTGLHQTLHERDICFFLQVTLVSMTNTPMSKHCSISDSFKRNVAQYPQGTEILVYKYQPLPRGLRVSRRND